MTDSIKLGDLVMIVRPRQCCGIASRMGLVATAKAPASYVLGVECQNCGSTDFNLRNYYCLDECYVHVSRLKKIDPPALDESVERMRELEQA